MQLEKLEEVAIDAAQMKLWVETRSTLVWHCPAFAHILYSMLNKKGTQNIAFFTRSFPNVGATDGRKLLLNPDRFFALPLPNRIFVVAHEICHCMFGHVELMFKLRMLGVVRYPDGFEIPYDDELMNIAMDLVINDLLIVSQVGEFNPIWLWNTSIAKHTDTVLDSYRSLYKKSNGGSAKPQGEGFDLHLNPGATDEIDAHTAASQRNEIEWKTAIAGALATGKAQGKMPAGLKRLLEDMLEPTVDWTDAVIGYYNHKPGSGGYDWRKPDRRLITRGIITPARSGHGIGNLVIGLDTSGSIGQPELTTFFGNMAGILDDLNPRRLFLMWCDSYVHRVDEVEDLMDLIDIRMNKGAPGGGGTSFVPVFDKIEEMDIEVDSLIYLTDGAGRFPDEAPEYPVLWGDIAGTTYPFGDVIHVPIKT